IFLALGPHRSPTPWLTICVPDVGTVAGVNSALTVLAVGTAGALSGGRYPVAVPAIGTVGTCHRDRVLIFGGRPSHEVLGRIAAGKRKLGQHPLRRVPRLPLESTALASLDESAILEFPKRRVGTVLASVQPLRGLAYAHEDLAVVLAVVEIVELD